MYFKILTSQILPFKLKLKRIISYWTLNRKARISWKLRFKKVFINNPSYRNSINKIDEKAHYNYWSFLSRKFSMNTLRVCYHISGLAPAEIIPEEIWVSDIEHSLNTEKGINYICNKSFYEHWFPDGKFPKCFLHDIDGQLFDEKLDYLSTQDFIDIAKKINYPAVLKPNKNSYGGAEIFFLNNFDDLIEKIKDRINYVVQEKIEQHPFFSKFNSFGLNTIRVYLYKSVYNNQIHIINTTLRMGVGGSLDNETAGGIVCFIRQNGQLNGFAVDKYGKKFITHPDSKLGFNEVIPDYDKLLSQSIKIGKKLFFGRLIGLDATLDNKSEWRFIEINPFGHTIRFSQYAGQPFFGDFTNEVRDYCKTNHWSLNV